MKLIIALLTTTILSFTALAEKGKTVDIENMPASGVHVIKEFKGKPVMGVLTEFKIKLPPYTNASYSSRDAKVWPAGANRMLSWPAKDNIGAILDKSTDLNPACGTPNELGMTAYFKLASGEYLTLIPICNDKAMSTLVITKSGELSVRTVTLGKTEVAGDLPVLAWGRNEDFYRSNHLAWGHAIKAVKGMTDWRMNKVYPEPFKYLGWCSWEQYKKNINSDLLVGAADDIEKSGLPVRWFLVDDGFQTEKQKQLQSFKPSPKTFAQEWAPLLAKRKEDKIKWFGLWHCYYGLWGGIHKENDFGELNKTLVSSKRTFVPGKSRQDAQDFYDAFIGSVADYGFDFVKIDVQSTYLRMVKGKDNPIQMNYWVAQALENVCKKRMNGLINCMAHNSACLFNTRYSAVTRCSIDYKLGDDAKAKSHLMQSYNNSLWMGQTVWPDHDMFHSSDEFCGQMMAISKALSGAPIYLSDDPKHFRKEFITPLAYEDGELLRPLAPAVPLPESAFIDVFSTPQSYRVIAPLANKCAAIALYNLMHKKKGKKGVETTVTAEISAADYPHATGMIQPATEPWKVPAEGLVVYDWYKGKGQVLEDSYKVELKGFSDALLLMSPVEKGWAVIGAANRYLSPAAVKSVSAGTDKLEVEMTESSPLVVYSRDGVVQVDGYKVTDLGNGFWRVELPVGKRDTRVTILRK